MGWAFPFGSSIKSQDDVWTPDVFLGTPDRTAVTVESTNVSLAVLPDEVVQFGFLGTKTGEGRQEEERRRLQRRRRGSALFRSSALCRRGRRGWRLG